MTTSRTESARRLLVDLRLHAGVLLVVLLALIPLIDNGRITVPDEAVYAAQATLVAGGSWSEPRPVPSIDRTGRDDALASSWVGDGRRVPYAVHPLWIRALAPFAGSGLGAMMVVSVLGVWAAALGAALMARRIDRRLGVPTLWLTAIGTPLVFAAYLVAANALAAACAAFVVLGVAHVVEDRRWFALAWTVPVAGLLVLLRSEGAIVVVAVGLALGARVAWAVLRDRARPDVHSVVTAMALIATVFVARLADAWWGRALTGDTAYRGSSSASTVLGGQSGPWQAARISLFQPWGSGLLEHQRTLVIVPVVVALAALTYLGLRRHRVVTVALLAVGAVAAVVQIAAAHAPMIPGLFAVFPLLVFGVAALRRADLTRPVAQLAFGTAVLSTVGLLLTIYSDGGAAQWGGRFFNPLLPILTPVVALGLWRAWTDTPRNLALPGGVAAVVISLVIAVMALQANAESRRYTDVVVEGTTRFALAHAVEDRPLVVAARVEPDGLSRFFWDDDRIDVITSPGLADFFDILRRADRLGYRSVTLASNINPTVFAGVSAKALDAMGWEMYAHGHIARTDLDVAVFGRSLLR